MQGVTDNPKAENAEYVRGVRAIGFVSDRREIEAIIGWLSGRDEVQRKSSGDSRVTRCGGWFEANSPWGELASV